MWWTAKLCTKELQMHLVLTTHRLTIFCKLIFWNRLKSTVNSDIVLFHFTLSIICIIFTQQFHFSQNKPDLNWHLKTNSGSRETFCSNTGAGSPYPLFLSGY